MGWAVKKGGATFVVTASLCFALASVVAIVRAATERVDMGKWPRVGFVVLVVVILCCNASIFIIAINQYSDERDSPSMQVRREKWPTESPGIVVFINLDARWLRRNVTCSFRRRTIDFGTKCDMRVYPGSCIGCVRSWVEIRFPQV